MEGSYFHKNLKWFGVFHNDYDRNQLHYKWPPTRQSCILGRIQLRSPAGVLGGPGRLSMTSLASCDLSTIASLSRTAVCMRLTLWSSLDGRNKTFAGQCHRKNSKGMFLYSAISSLSKLLKAFTLHNLAALFIPTPTRVFREPFSHAAITAR